MPDVTLRNATDTWANSDKPTQRNSGSRVLSLRSGGRNGYLYFNRAAPLGATITSAKLRVYLANTWPAATRTLSAHLLAESWKASRLNWQNKPGVSGTATTVAVNSGGPAGTMVEFDVTAQLQQVSDGARWYGWRLTSNEGTNRNLGSTDGLSTLRPTLTVAWTEEPQQPTTLAPSGNRAVSNGTPTLSFDFTDELGDTALAAVQVQIDPAGNWTAPAWDSGEVATTVPQLDLTGTTYPALAHNASTYWRVRVRDGAGLWSEWSDDEQFKRVNLGTGSITNPVGNAVTEPTPPFSWSYTGTQVAWQVKVVDPANPSTVYANSKKQTGTTQVWTPPNKTLTGLGPYLLEVHIWDAVEREAVADAPDHVVVTREFSITSDPTVGAITGLTATQPDRDRPAVVLTWDRGTAPDSFVVRRDSTAIDDEVLPSEALVSGTTYTYADDLAAPWRAHSWEVQAIVNGVASEWQSVTYAPEVRGIWLTDRDRDLVVWLAGAEGGTFNMGEEASVFLPVGGAHAVRRVQQQRGYEGSLSGMLVDRSGLTAVESEANLVAMRAEPSRPVALTVGDLALRVVLGNVGTFPTPQGTPPQRVASFEFWETPE